MFPLPRYEDCENTREQKWRISLCATCWWYMNKIEWDKTFHYLPWTKQLQITFGTMEGDNRSTNSAIEMIIQKLTFAVVSQSWSHLYWMTGQLQLKVLWWETSLSQVSHWRTVNSVCSSVLLMLTRSIKILRKRKVQTNNDWLWWFNPPGLGHLLLWTPNSVNILNRSRCCDSKDVTWIVCVFYFNLPPKSWH